VVVVPEARTAAARFLRVSRSWASMGAGRARCSAVPVLTWKI
jgi:hypothetical protein